VLGGIVLREDDPALGLDRSRLSVPSLAVPESTTPMARSWRSCASDSKKESI
jgi:hypothetical protein